MRSLPKCSLKAVALQRNAVNCVFILFLFSLNDLIASSLLQDRPDLFLAGVEHRPFYDAGAGVTRCDGDLARLLPCPFNVHGGAAVDAHAPISRKRRCGGDRTIFYKIGRLRSARHRAGMWVGRDQPAGAVSIRNHFPGATGMMGRKAGALWFWQFRRCRPPGFANPPRMSRSGAGQAASVGLEST